MADDEGSVEPALAAAWDEARAAHPGIEVDRAAFARRIAASAESASKLAVADVYLALACERGDPRALATFEALALDPVPAFVAGVAGAADVVDEIRQRVREKLLVAPEPGAPPRIAEYSGRGPIAAWVRVVAVRIAIDLRRAEGGPRPLAAEDVAVDHELSIIRDKYREPFRAALRAALAELSTEDRSWIKLHFLEGWNLERLAVVFGVSRATAGRRIVAVRERLAARTKDLLGEQLGATSEEVASLVALLQDNLEYSLRSALDTHVTG